MVHVRRGFRRVPGLGRRLTARITLALILACCVAPVAIAGEIAITFDDAPRPGSALFTGERRAETLIESLAAAEVRGAIFFAVSGHMDGQGMRRLQRYQDSGHYVANHSHSHAHPSDLGLAGYVEDVRAADERLRDQPAYLPLFRFPFLDEGRDVAMRDGIRRALGEMGLAHGYVTVDNYDWYMDALLQRALASGREVDYERLGRIYVDVLVEAVEFYDALATRALGRSPRHVLLLHENDLAAMYVDDLVGELRRRGWRIVPGPEAYLDPIAGIVPDTLFNNQGRVAAVAETLGVPRRELVHPAEDEAWLERHFEQKGVFGKAPPPAMESGARD